MHENSCSSFFKRIIFLLCSIVGAVAEGDSLALHCATPMGIISCVIGARISSLTLIKWRIFVEAKLTPSKNGYFLLTEYGGPHILFHSFADNGVFME